MNQQTLCQRLRARIEYLQNLFKELVARGEQVQSDAKARIGEHPMGRRLLDQAQAGQRH